MIVKRQFLKTKPVCKVTFKVSAEESGNASHVVIAGTFNGWNESSAPLKKGKDGSFETTVEFNTGSEYEFRYLADGKRWFNEPDADKSAKTAFGSENSILAL